MRGRKIENGRYGKTYADILTKEYLLEEYINKKLTPYDIAKNISCSPKTVYTYIDYYKIDRVDHTGQIEKDMIFGLLTTIKIVGKTKNGTNIWLCKCACGNMAEVPTVRLKNGRNKSCGCYKKRKKNHFWKGYCDVSGSLVAEIRLRAKKKGWDFNLTARFLWELLQKQNNKCAISGIDISLDKNASVDRIDSSCGYTRDNVWWVHKDVNKMKMDLPFDYFLNMCDIIVKYNKEQN